MILEPPRFAKPQAAKVNRTACSGFVLIEMMIALGLLAIVGLMAAQVFRSVSRAWHQAAVQQSAEMRLDQAVHQLRLDVWNASSMESPDPQTLRIHPADGPAIEWRLGKAVERSSGAATPPQVQRWSDFQAELSIALHGDVVEINAGQGPGVPAGQITLVSQSMLLNRRQP